MGKLPLTKKEIERIVFLRSTGHSISEIRKVSKKGKATISKYIKGVQVRPEYANDLRAKQGGSKYRAALKWEEAETQAKKRISKMGKRDRIIILACLYWGEGNKTEFSLINSDPYLVKAVYECLSELGVSRESVRFSLRLYEDMDIGSARKFWSRVLGVPISKISRINILKGKKAGKLKYGMCRLRIEKGESYFKLIMSMISLMRLEFNAAVVQWIEQGTPKS